MKFINNFDVVKNDRILLWNPLTVQVVTTSFEKQVIHATITCLMTSKTFHLSLSYGYYQITERRELWDSLISNILDSPALIGGDFNVVLNPDERVGGRVPLEREY